MSLSQSVQDRLDSARILQLQYRPNDDTSQQLRSKTLAMIVSPTACGKSYLMRQITERDPSCHRVIDITSRSPRADDQPDVLQYLPHEDRAISAFLDKIHRHELVQYMVHPTTGMVYGTEIGSYPGDYNFLETISSVVTVLRTLPFRQTIVIGLAVDVNTWQQWFNARYPEANSERLKRLQEAATSLEWLTDVTHDSLVHWALNDPSRDAAATVIDIVKNGARGDDGRPVALSMLAWARQQLEQTL